MGKSTTAQMFRDAGVPTWDADETVHRLYAAGGAGAAAIAKLVPKAIKNNAVDRPTLRAAFLSDASLSKRVEAVIHPLVAQDRAAFLKAHGDQITLCDIPLLFETGGDQNCDQIIVVTAPPDIQRARVLDRPGMTEAAFEGILARQTPDAEKRARADHIIDTSKGLDAARAQVQSLLKQLGHR